MPKRYDPEKAKMCRRKGPYNKGLLRSSVEVINEILQRNDPKLEGSLNVRKLYAGKGERETAIADEDINDFLK